MKKFLLITCVAVVSLFACNKDSSEYQLTGQTDVQQPNVIDNQDLEDRASCNIQIQVQFINPSGGSAFIDVKNQSGTTLWDYTCACIGDSNCNNFWQTIGGTNTGDTLTVQLHTTSSTPLACDNVTGNVTVRLKKQGSFAVHTQTLYYTAGNETGGFKKYKVNADCTLTPL